MENMTYGEKKDPLTKKAERHRKAYPKETIETMQRIEKELDAELKNVSVVRNKFTIHEAEHIGNRLGINWDEISSKEFYMGINVELEHGKRDLETNVTDDDGLTTGKIALAHLKEKRDYYTLLKKYVEG